MLRRQFSCIVICCTFPLEKQSEFRARHFDEVYRLCKNRKAPDNETKGSISITKIYSPSSSEFTNFGLKKLKGLNLTDFKFKFIENIFLVNVNYQL